MVKFPYCNYEDEFKFGKTWKFRFYDFKRMVKNSVFTFIQGSVTKMWRYQS